MPHFNIYTWQTKSLVDKSTGVCTFGDPACQMTRETEEMLQEENIKRTGMTITGAQAKAVCNSYVNAYLRKSRRAPYQRSVATNDTISSVLAGCEADLLLTGLHEVSNRDRSISSECTW